MRSMKRPSPVLHNASHTKRDPKRWPASRSLTTGIGFVTSMTTSDRAVNSSTITSFSSDTEAQIDAKACSRDALEASCEAFESVVLDPECDPVERDLASCGLRVFRAELDRRGRVAGKATRWDQDHGSWIELARWVRQRWDVPDVLTLAGIPMFRTGTSRGRAEWHGPCPVCGTGEDRLMAWSGPNGRLWCRQCQWSGDVISAASLVAGNHFRDCVRWLAERVAAAPVLSHG